MNNNLIGCEAWLILQRLPESFAKIFDTSAIDHRSLLGVSSPFVPPSDWVVDLYQPICRPAHPLGSHLLNHIAPLRLAKIVFRSATGRELLSQGARPRLFSNAIQALNKHTIRIVRAISATTITPNSNTRIRPSYEGILPPFEIRLAKPANPLAFTSPILLGRQPKCSINFLCSANEFMTITKKTEKCRRYIRRDQCDRTAADSQSILQNCNADSPFHRNSHSASLCDCGAYGRADSDKRFGSH